MQDFTHLVRILMAKLNQITYCHHKSGWLTILTKNYSLENKYFQIVWVIVLICSCKSRVVLWQTLQLSTNQFYPRSMESYFQLFKQNYYYRMTSGQLCLLFRYLYKLIRNFDFIYIYIMTFPQLPLRLPYSFTISTTLYFRCALISRQFVDFGDALHPSIKT